MNYKYIKVDFDHVWQAVKAFEDGEELYWKALFHDVYQKIERPTDCCQGVYKRISIQWFDNMPEGGVLCWCWNTSKENGAMVVVKSHNDGRFIVGDVTKDWFRNAEPVSKEELQILLDNAPEPNLKGEENE